MAQWEFIVILYDTLQGGGYSYGKVRYPGNYKDQDVNQILNLLGQQGWEIVSSHEGSDHCVAITLKRQKA
jgi:hypothetical protein